MTSQKPRLGPERRGALGLLADAPRGLTESIMVAHGFTAEILAGLVRDGLATAASETVRAGGRTIKEERIKITDAGLRALED